MGIGPLVAWRRASLRALGKTFIVPTIAAVVTGIALIATGFGDSTPGLIAYTFSAFVLASIALEFIRGTRARRALSGGPWPLAFSSLIGRNRRRYGGYIVHAAIVLLAIGIAGSSAYDTVNERRLVPGDIARRRRLHADVRGRSRSGSSGERAATIGAVDGVQRDGKGLVTTLHAGKSFVSRSSVRSRTRCRSRSDPRTAEDVFAIAEQGSRRTAPSTSGLREAAREPRLARRRRLRVRLDDDALARRGRAAPAGQRYEGAAVTGVNASACARLGAPLALAVRGARRAAVSPRATGRRRRPRRTQGETRPPQTDARRGAGSRARSAEGARVRPPDGQGLGRRLPGPRGAAPARRGGCVARARAARGSPACNRRATRLTRSRERTRTGRQRKVRCGAGTRGVPTKALLRWPDASWSCSSSAARSSRRRRSRTTAPQQQKQALDAKLAAVQASIAHERAQESQLNTQIGRASRRRSTRPRRSREQRRREAVGRWHVPTWSSVTSASDALKLLSIVFQTTRVRFPEARSTRSSRSTARTQARRRSTSQPTPGRARARRCRRSSFQGCRSTSSYLPRAHRRARTQQIAAGSRDLRSTTSSVGAQARAVKVRRERSASRGELPSINARLPQQVALIIPQRAADEPVEALEGAVGQVTRASRRPHAGAGRGQGSRAGRSRAASAAIEAKIRASEAGSTSADTPAATPSAAGLIWPVQRSRSPARSARAGAASIPASTSACPRGRRSTPPPRGR